MNDTKEAKFILDLFLTCEEECHMILTAQDEVTAGLRDVAIEVYYRAGKEALSRGDKGAAQAAFRWMFLFLASWICVSFFLFHFIVYYIYIKYIYIYIYIYIYRGSLWCRTSVTWPIKFVNVRLMFPTSGQMSYWYAIKAVIVWSYLRLPGHGG